MFINQIIRHKTYSIFEVVMPKELSVLMSPMFYKQSAMKHEGRIIPNAKRFGIGSLLLT